MDLGRPSSRSKELDKSITCWDTSCSLAGYQVGASPAKFQVRTELMKGDSWLHDPESFAKMWDEVGEMTGTVWKTKAGFKTVKEMGWVSEDMPEHTGRKMIEFTVNRV